MIFVWLSIVIMSERVEYPLTPPEGSWKKMKINSFFPNGKLLI